MNNPILHASRQKVLTVLILSQFFCTSIWFATNGIMDSLIAYFNLAESSQAHLTSSVQLGFISGTLLFAMFTISDRFSPSKVFFISACLTALSNLGILLEFNSIYSLVIFRFFSGFFLAGIYPVGMKIAADYFNLGLGKSLGYLVGALVLGTALPHLLNGWTVMETWQYVVISTSLLSLIGGGLVLVFLPDGPHRTAGKSLDLTAFVSIFKNKDFRSAAFGYFGHMWELYAFWAFIPLILKEYSNTFKQDSLDISLWSFLIIAIGSLSCVLGGYLSEVIGNKRTALIALTLSACCCLLFPVFFNYLPVIGFMTYLLIWGFTVIADSPQLSTLVANSTNPEIKGTALTITNCIGFGITIVSIQLLNWLQIEWSISFSLLILALGPIFGIINLTAWFTKK